MVFSACLRHRFYPGLVVLIFSLWAQKSSAQIYADFETSGGNFTIEMFHQDQPMTVANFIGLADGSIAWLDFDTLEVREGVPFYNGVTFHRVIKDFMIQGGSRNGQGTDNPGYQFVDRFARDTDGALLHPHDQQGLISMANSGINTNGAQFFITDVPTPWLNGKHVVFGKIAAGPSGTLEKGLVTITALNDTPTNGSKPDEPLVIHSIAIRRIGDEAMAFDVHAQGLPVLSAPQAKIVVDEFSQSAALHYTKPVLSQVDVLTSNDLLTWETMTSAFYGEMESSADDISALYKEKDSQFFRLLKIDYTPSPHTGGPDNIANATLKLAFDSVFDIDLSIDATGSDGTWNRPDGGGGGTLQSIDYTPRPSAYVDHVRVLYEGLAPNPDFVFAMGISLSFDTPISGRFTGTTNGRPQTVSGTFEFAP